MVAKIIMPQLVSSSALTATTKSALNHNANLIFVLLCGAHSGSPQIIQRTWTVGGLVITHTSHDNTEVNGHNNYFRYSSPSIIQTLDYLNSLEATFYYE